MTKQITVPHLIDRLNNIKKYSNSSEQLFHLYNSFVKHHADDYGIGKNTISLYSEAPVMSKNEYIQILLQNFCDTLDKANQDDETASQFVADFAKTKDNEQHYINLIKRIHKLHYSTKKYFVFDKKIDQYTTHVPKQYINHVIDHLIDYLKLHQRIVKSKPMIPFKQALLDVQNHKWSKAIRNVNKGLETAYDPKEDIYRVSGSFLVHGLDKSNFKHVTVFDNTIYLKNYQKLHKFLKNPNNIKQHYYLIGSNDSTFMVYSVVLRATHQNLAKLVKYAYNQQFNEIRDMIKPPSLPF